VRPLSRRILAAPLVFLAVAALTMLIPRVLRPQDYGGQALVSGVLDDLVRSAHLDWGRASAIPGAPEIGGLFRGSWQNDLWLLGGALLLGPPVGVRLGAWCVRRPTARATRLLHHAATTLYCLPVYVAGMGLLLLFHPTFGLVHLPWLLDVQPRWPTPWGQPLVFLQTLLVPWVVLATPLAAMCLRATLALASEEMQEDHIRSALAFGLSGRMVGRRAVRASLVSVAALVAVAVPALVMNAVLVERVLAVPGFLRYTFRAIGPGADVSEPDIPLIQAVTLWGSLLIVVGGVLADVVAARLDPRVRS
jgi:peptide/nickel transport system permease protein